jgi:hypothetical protein
MADNNTNKNESKLKIAVSGIKKETLTTNKKFSKFIKYLKNYGSVSLKV